jgi:predicted dinucleotide-binding enzyme
VLFDATNPLDFSRGVPPTLAVSGDDSGGERIQRWLPDARVVKAFNTVSNVQMVEPHLPGGPPDMFICGEDAEAKQIVTELANSLGWPVIDLGGIANARYLESMAMVFIVHAFNTGNWNVAFKLLR